MLTTSNFAAHAARLVDLSETPDSRRTLVAEVRDAIEVVHSAEYGTFLFHFFPAFRSILTVLTRPQAEDNAVHKTRVIVLEILGRLPHNEVLRPRVHELLPIVMDVLRSDNEVNAVNAVHIIFDLHKNFRPSLEPDVQPFLDFVRHLYASFNETIASAFPTQPRSDKSILNSSTRSFKVIMECPLIVMFLFQLYPIYMKHNIPLLLPFMVKSIEYRVSSDRLKAAHRTTYQDFLAAQVKTVSFLAFLLKQFQDIMKPYEQTIPSSVVQLLQACPGDAVSIRKELLVATRHILATSLRVGFFGHIDLLLNERVLVGDGRAAYETLRPLAYSFLAELVHYIRMDLSLEQLSRIIYLFSTNVHDRTLSYTIQTTSVRLLLNLIEGILKKDDSEQRPRQLLVRIMYTIVTKYSSIAIQVPRLLQGLSGTGNPGPFGSTKDAHVTADPVKEVNDCKNLIKTLTLGLKTVVWSAINIRIPPSNGLGISATRTAGPLAGAQSSGSNATSTVPSKSAALGVGASADAAATTSATHAHAAMAAAKKSGEVVATASTSLVHPQSAPRTGLLEEECELLARLLVSAQQCFRLYSHQPHSNKSQSQNVTKSASQEIGSVAEPGETAKGVTERTEESTLNTTPTSTTPTLGTASGSTPTSIVSVDEKEILETFAQIFTVLDVRSFQDVFGLRMPELFEHIVENAVAIAIPQHFLTNSSISKYFADILLNYLVSHIGDLGIGPALARNDNSNAEKRAQALLRLFRILFASVSLFPRNEPVLKPHLNAIVRECIAHAALCENPTHYLNLLRALFKSLANGKPEPQFDLLYREFVPLVEPVLDGLLELYNGPQRIEHKDVIIELCLMIPARPSTTFPFLRKQLKPIVWALQNGRENLHYGLRALEFWIDSLQPSYLDGLLDEFEPALTVAIQNHARASPRHISGAVMLRILGKLGNRSRRMMRDIVEPNSNPHPAASLFLQLHWTDRTPFTLEVDGIIDAALKILTDDCTRISKDSLTEHRLNAWGLLCTNLVPFLGLCDDAGNINDMDGSTKSSRFWWLNSSFCTAPFLSDLHAVNLEENQKKSLIRRRELNRSALSLLRKIITGIVISAGIEELSNVTVSSLSTSCVWRSQSPRDVAFGMCRYFALLHAKGLGSSARKREVASAESLSSAKVLGSPDFLDPDIFFDAVVEVISHERRDFAQAGLDALTVYVEALVEYSASGAGPSLHRNSSTPSLNSRPTATSLDSVHAAESDAKAKLGGQKPSEQDLQSEQPLPKSDVDMTDIPDQTCDKADATAMIDADGGGNASSSVPASSNVSPSQQLLVAKSGRSTPSPAKTQALLDASSIGEQDKGKNSLLDECRNEIAVPSALSSLVERLCHCCYQRTWHSKWAGAAAFGAIIPLIPVSVFQVRTSGSYVAHVVRALMFIVRDLPSDVTTSVTAIARKSLKVILVACHGPRARNVSRDSVMRAFRDVTLCLAVDLISESMSARNAAKEALQTLSTALSLDISDVMKLAKENVVRSVTQRSLRQMPLPVQIGYIDAVTFCVDRDKPVICDEIFKAPLRESFFLDVVAISEDATFEKLTEADDNIRQKLIESNFIKTCTVRQLCTLRLRAVEFLRVIVLKCSQLLREPANDEVFRKMISSFFRSIQSRDADIVNFAKQGLKQSIAQHPKPKELLQSNLRPVLVNLSDYKKLSIPYLQGLSRVLELLSHWFSVQLGDKLLEHLVRWTEPEKLAQVKRWPLGTEPLVGAAILDLFHKLPPLASKFIVPVVEMVVRLEAVLTIAGPGIAHRGLRGPNAASTSPYREPLLKFCNCHPVDTIAYFLGHLGHPQIRRLFLVLIQADEGSPLRAELGSNPERLIQATFLSPRNDITGGLFAFTGVLIVDTLARCDSSWLAANHVVLDRLVAYWNDASRLERLKREELLSIDQLSESRIMAECFVRHCRDHAEDVYVLFHLLQVFSIRTLNDFSFVKDFFANEVAKIFLGSHKREILKYFLNLFVDESIPQERKEHALQYLILPMLAEHLEYRRVALDDASNSLLIANEPLSGNRSVAARSVVPFSAPSSTVAFKAGEEKESCSFSKLNPGVAKAEMMLFPDSGISRPPVSNSDSANMSIRSSAGASLLQAHGQDQGTPTNAVRTKDDVLDEEILRRVMSDLMDRPDEILRQYDEPLSAELLQLATLLIQYIPNLLGGYRKELIRFGWNHLKREDSVAKQWAFVNVSRFFEAYQAPDKIILQVYVALLRFCQQDGRHLVRRALDILTPALPKRLKHNVVDHKYPIWIRYTKKILLEEAHSVPHLVHIWQLIVRHADLFYVARAQFVPIMVTSLSRIGLVANSTLENKRLALDLAELIIRWESKRLTSSGVNNASKDFADCSTAEVGQVGSKRGRENSDDVVSQEPLPASNDIVTAGSHEKGGHDERPSKLLKHDNGSAVVSLSSFVQTEGNSAVQGSLGKQSQENEQDPTHVSSRYGTRETSAGQRAQSDYDDFRPTSSMVDMVVNFLAQLAFRQLDRPEIRSIAERCISLICFAVDVWPHAQVRLQFLDKFLDQAVPERPTAPTVPAPGGARGKNSEVTPSSASTLDTKGNSISAGLARNESSKGDKIDNLLADRAAVRLLALHVALRLSITLVEKQGGTFLLLNAGTIRSMVTPAICDRNVTSANLFAKLLSNLMRVCPFRDSSSMKPAASNCRSAKKTDGENKSTSERDSDVATVFPPGGSGSNIEAVTSTKTSSAMPALTHVPVKRENSTLHPQNTANSTNAATPASHTLGQIVPASSTPGSLGRSTTSASHSANVTPQVNSNSKIGYSHGKTMPSGSIASSDAVYVAVENALERCLKADTISVQCGLIVLHAFVKVYRNDFQRYQDLVVKALQRVAKESLQVSQPQAGGSANFQSGGISASSASAKDSSSSGQGAGALAATALASGSRNGSEAHASQADASQTTMHSGPDNPGDAVDITADGQALTLGLALLGKHITSLETQQRRTFLQIVGFLIDRCVQVKVLMEVVRITREWILWKPSSDDKHEADDSLRMKEPLSLKEKITLLLKMTVFERNKGLGADKLMEAYLSIILSVFGGGDAPERRPELLQKLERAFMLGLKSRIASVRVKFFAVFDAAVDRSVFERLRYIIAKQEWETLSDTYWIQQALELVLAAIDTVDGIRTYPTMAHLPGLRRPPINMRSDDGHTTFSLPQQDTGASSSTLFHFLNFMTKLQTRHFIWSLRDLIYSDTALAHVVWSRVFPEIWNLIPPLEQATMDGALSRLLAKEHHFVQMTWSQNVIQAILDGARRCEPMPPICPEILMHVGVRWNAWHIVLPMLEMRSDILRRSLVRSGIVDRRVEAKTEAELETTLDAIAGMYRMLNEFDMFAGAWKSRAGFAQTINALSLEQQGLFLDAQTEYTNLTISRTSDVEAGIFANLTAGRGCFEQPLSEPASGESVGVAEVCLWEERWIDCARELCQWDVLTEFSRSCMQTELLHECLWRSSEWSALKELLLKHPVEDGPKQKLYQSYVQLFENKLDIAESQIQQGMQRALEKFCSLPNTSGYHAKAAVLVQFQQFVELQESNRILSELNALSCHGAVNINVEQKIDSMKVVLNTWRERLPLLYESLTIWDDLLSWRNSIYEIIANVLKGLEKVATQTMQAAKPSGQISPQPTGSNSSQLHIAGVKGPNAQVGGTVQQAQVQAAEAIASALSNQQVLIMGGNETAWSVHRFARTCRKQGLPAVALTALQKRNSFGKMELVEYFFRMKETAKAYLAQPAGVDNCYLHGLSEVNRCDLDRFSPHQKCELITLKGRFLKGLKNEDEASDAFSTALNTASDVCSAWFAWARHSDDMQTKVSQARTEPSPDPCIASDLPRSDLAWREAATNCYFQAIKYGSRPARQYIPRILRLLSLDLCARKVDSVSDDYGTPRKASVIAAGASGSDQTASQLPSANAEDGVALDVGEFRDGVYGVLVEYIAVLPPWIWLPWITQLMPMLTRPEAPAARSILFRITQEYPQAAFFPLRAFLEDRKSIDRPSRNQVAEALRSSRSLATPLVPAAASSQYAAAQNQYEIANSAVQQAKRRLLTARDACKKATEAAKAGSGTSDHAALVAHEARMKDEVQSLQSTFERAYRSYHTAGLQRNAVAAQLDISQHLSSSGASGAAGAVAVSNPTSLVHGPANGAQNISLNRASQALNPSSFAESVSAAAINVGNISAARSGQGLSSATSSSDGGQQSTGTKDEVTPENLSHDSSRPISDTPGKFTESANSNSQGRIDGNSILMRTHLTPKTPYEHAEIVLVRLVKSHQFLYTDIERIAQDLAKRMKPQQEEQLLGLMNALLHKCYQLSMQTGREVAPSLRSALEEVSRMCFNTVPRHTKADNPVKIQQNIADLKPAFEAELAPQTAINFPTKIEPFIGRLRRWKNIFQRRVDSMPDYQRLEILSRHLVEVQNSDVEVFGQYIVAEAVEPSPSSHIKIDRFASDTRVVRRHSGAARGVTVIGDNGKNYEFTLETSMNAACQPTEERAAQIFRLLNASMFGRHTEASRRRIRIEVPILVPTGQHVRLVSDDPQYSSLAEGLERHMEANGGNMDDPLMAFRLYAAEAYSRRHSTKSHAQAGRKDSIAARVEAYHVVCNKHVPDSCLSKWILSSIPAPNEYFNFQKTFSETLGVVSIVSYVLAIGARRPQNVLFSWNSGAVSNLHMRPLLTNSGLLECDEAVPFRLTRNIRRLLGSSGVHGPLFGAMAVTLRALRSNDELLSVYLNGILRDELSTWTNSRGDNVSRGSITTQGGIDVAGSTASATSKDALTRVPTSNPAEAIAETCQDNSDQVQMNHNVEQGDGMSKSDFGMATVVLDSKHESAVSNSTDLKLHAVNSAPEYPSGQKVQQDEAESSGGVGQTESGKCRDRGRDSGPHGRGHHPGRSGPTTRPEEFESVEGRLAESVQNIFKRLRGEDCSKADIVEYEDHLAQDEKMCNINKTLRVDGKELKDFHWDDVTRTVYTLIDRAGRPEYLAQMDSSWQAWF